MVGNSTRKSTINCRISGGRLRAVSGGCLRGLDANKLTMPCSSKASALRSRVGVAHLSLLPVEWLDRRKGRQGAITHMPFAPARACTAGWFSSPRYALVEPACVWAPCSLQHDEIG